MVVKDALVTLVGGGGFVGRYVAQGLMKAGARIRVAQRDPRGAWFLKPLGGLGQSQFVAADVARPETIARAIQGSDAVVNLAGAMGRGMARINVDGARAVAEAAAASGVRALVHLSAIGADPGGRSAYLRSKGNGEAAVRGAFPSATILRPSIVFGREDQFVNRFAAMIETASAIPFAPVPVLRAGVAFQPVFVGDVADAAVAALGDDRAAGETYELGGPDRITMDALIRWIATTIDRRPSIVELPDFAGSLIARGGALPGAPITWDQWLSLQQDNVVGGEDGLAALGVAPTPLAAVAPEWLVRFRKAGRFGARAAVAD